MGSNRSKALVLEPLRGNGQSAQNQRQAVHVDDSVADIECSEDGKWVTEAEYWEHYYECGDFHYEWNGGILEEKGMSDIEQMNFHDWFFSLLREYLTAHPIAQFIYLETGIRLALAHKTAIRKPDLFLVRHDNPVQYEMPDRTYPGICDLAIESVSDSTPDEVERDVVDKKIEYALGGIQEYFILDVRHGHTNFYQLTANNTYQAIAPTPDGIICSQVLSGFQFRPEHLETQPPLIDLIDDPVYQGYVMVAYQAQLRLVAQGKQRVQAERQRADHEQQRAEQFAAKLRALGIDPNTLTDPSSLSE